MAQGPEKEKSSWDVDKDQNLLWGSFLMSSSLEKHECKKQWKIAKPRADVSGLTVGVGPELGMN